MNIRYASIGKTLIATLAISIAAAAPAHAAFPGDPR
jgi:hypothetical protein